MRIKKGDKVIVIAGKNKGATGTISRALPERNMVVIDGVNVVKKHRRPNAKSPHGQIVDRAMPIHASNVMIADPKTGKPTRVRMVVGKDGARVRTAVKSGETLA